MSKEFLLGLLAVTGTGTRESGVVPPDPSSFGAEIEAFIANHSNYTAVQTVTTTAGTSIMDAIATLSAVVTSSYDKHPGDRGLLILNPGVYNQRVNRALTSRTRIDIVSSTMNPLDVTIVNPDGSEDAFEVSSAQGIIAGISIFSNQVPSGGSSAAALHMGDTFTGADQFVVHKCILTAPGSENALSWGANRGQSLFISQTVIDGGGFMHNFPVTKLPTFVQFAQCTFVNGAHGILDESGNLGDVLNVIGGTFSGSYGYSAGGTVANRTWTGKIDPTAGSVPAGSPFTAGVASYISPITGDEYWNHYWWPDARGTGLVLPLVPATTTAACVADRCYYVPFTVPAAHNSGAAQWTFPVPAGNLRLALLDNTATNLPGAILWNAELVAITASLSRTGFSRILVPGEKYWLCYAASSAAATGNVGAAPAGTRYLDIGAAAITANPAGTTPAAGNILSSSMSLT